MINTKPGNSIVMGTALDCGYASAADAFSILVQESVSVSPLQHAHYNLDDDAFFHYKYPADQHTSHLITTDVFGDLTGKSYLFLSENEFSFSCRNIPVIKDPSVNLQEEFIKEVDNIISAAVITQLSNGLQHDLFGDVPVSKGQVTTTVHNLVHEDFRKYCENVFISAVQLTFKNHPQVKPLFVWAFDISSFNK